MKTLTRTDFLLIVIKHCFFPCVCVCMPFYNRGHDDYAAHLFCAYESNFSLSQLVTAQFIHPHSGIAISFTGLMKCLAMS